jgi:hypothetical protein
MEVTIVMTKWVTVDEASVMLGMSERSIRRHIKDGKIDSKIEGKRRLVGIESRDDNYDKSVMTNTDKDALVSWLKNELEEKNKQIQRLQDELRHNRERSDAIVIKLAEELEAQRNILEGKPTKRKRDESIWHRLGIKSQGEE